MICETSHEQDAVISHLADLYASVECSALDAYTVRLRPLDETGQLAREPIVLDDEGRELLEVEPRELRDGDWLDEGARAGARIESIHDDLPFSARLDDGRNVTFVAPMYVSVWRTFEVPA
jgi:hypothetical protein